jgi:uncharacterized protein (TIGR03435 family)
VVDRTGLSGVFNFELSWQTLPLDGAPAGERVGDVAAIVTALQDQLGLKLEATRVPFEVVGIETVRRPTPD